MKQISLTLCWILVFSAGSSLHILAQERTQEQKAKVIIIEEIIDDNGEVTKQKRVLEGAEALEYIKQNPEVAETYREVEMEVKKEAETEKGSAGTTKKQYRIKIKDENGEVQEMEWDGTGEMPEEFKGLLDSEMKGAKGSEDQVTHTIKVDDTGKRTKMVIKKKGPGIEDVMDFDWEGEELPTEVREILEQEGIELEQLKDVQGKKQIRVVKTAKEKGEQKAGKKAQLGVNVGKDLKGAKVIGVNPESAAAEAGLKKGDIITQLDEFEVKDFMTLVDAISAHQPGDVVILTFLRGGQPISKKVTLKESIDPFPFKTWEEVMDLKK